MFIIIIRLYIASFGYRLSLDKPKPHRWFWLEIKVIDPRHVCHCLENHGRQRYMSLRLFENRVLSRITWVSILYHIFLTKWQHYGYHLVTQP